MTPGIDVLFMTAETFCQTCDHNVRAQRVTRSHLAKDQIGIAAFASTARNLLTVLYVFFFCSNFRITDKPSGIVLPVGNGTGSLCDRRLNHILDLQTHFPGNRFAI